MIIIVYAYRVLVLPVVSLVANIFYRIKYRETWADARAKMLDYMGRVISLPLLHDFVTAGRFTHVPDEIKGTFNFVPWSPAIFYARRGGDCSLWARIIFDMLKRIGLKPELYMIIDGINIWSAHIVTVFMYKGKWHMFNVTNLVKAEDEKTQGELIELFKEQYLVKVAGKRFRYKKLKKYRWF
jgi:hypothetical protein